MRLGVITGTMLGGALVAAGPAAVWLTSSQVYDEPPRRLLPSDLQVHVPPTDGQLQEHLDRWIRECLGERTNPRCPPPRLPGGPPIEIPEQPG